MNVLAFLKNIKEKIRQFINLKFAKITFPWYNKNILGESPMKGVFYI